MNNLIFKLCHTKTSTSLPGEKEGLNPLGRAKPTGGRMGFTGPWAALPPSTHCSPLAKHGDAQPPCPKRKSWSRWDRCCAAVQPDVGPHSHSLTTLGTPMGVAQDWLDRKQRRRGKSKGSSSELFNTSLYCLCF